MLSFSLGPTSSTGSTAPSGTAPILLTSSVVSRLRMPVSSSTSTGTSQPSTGYACNAGTCTGYGDTAIAFQSLQSLLNQAVLSVGDVGQPPAIAVSGTIDSATVSLVWWLHNSTYPQLFAGLNAAMASGDAQWIADNVDALISELHTFVSQYVGALQSLPPPRGYTAPAPSAATPPDTTGDGTSVTSAGGTTCPDGTVWDPTSGACATMFVAPGSGNVVPPNMAPAPAKLKPAHIGALALGGVALGVLVAFFHR